MASMDRASRVFSGTYGKLWLDGERVGECYGAQGKVSTNKEKVFLDGVSAVDSKVTNIECTGSLRGYKISSRFLAKIGTALKNGIDLRFTIISEVADPDVTGAERIAIYNVSFDDLTLFDWEKGTAGKYETPFTFTDFEPLDTVS